MLLAIIEANIIKGTMTNINATILEQILTINNFLLVNDWITKLAVNNNGIDEITKINNSPFLGASPSYPFKYCIIHIFKVYIRNHASIKRISSCSCAKI